MDKFDFYPIFNNLDVFQNIFDKIDLLAFRFGRNLIQILFSFKDFFYNL